MFKVNVSFFYYLNLVKTLHFILLVYKKHTWKWLVLINDLFNYQTGYESAVIYKNYLTLLNHTDMHYVRYTFPHVFTPTCSNLILTFFIKAFASFENGICFAYTRTWFIILDRKGSGGILDGKRFRGVHNGERSLDIHTF